MLRPRVWLILMWTMVAASPGLAAEPVKDAGIVQFPGLAAFTQTQLNAHSVGQGPTFSLPNHKDLISRLTGLKRKCTERLVRAQWQQDFFHQHNSFAHFDNCAFEEGIHFVESTWAEAKKNAPKKPLAAMEDIGRVLHAIQDFYAHSNYVELMTTAHAGFDEVPILTIWTPAGSAALRELIKPNGAGLYSGFWLLGIPKHCAHGLPDHGHLNKDKADSERGKVPIPQWESMTHFQAAFALANQATRAFINYAFIQAPILKDTCGEIVGFLEVADRRP